MLLRRLCGAQVVGDLLQYPNKMSFDIMDGGGVPPPPIGMLQVKVKSVKNITAGGDLLSKVDPYVELGVREGRYQRTKTVMNDKNPEYDEVFNVIVDDIHSQTLTFNLHDDDAGFNDPVRSPQDQQGSALVRCRAPIHATGPLSGLYLVLST